MLNLTTIVAVLLLLPSCKTLPGQSDPVREQVEAARIHVEAGEFTAAETAYRSALVLDGQDDVPVMGLAELYLRWGRPVEGLDALEELSPEGATSPEAQNLRVRLAADAEAWSQAIAAASALLAEEPANATAWHALIRAYLALGECDKAHTAADRALAAGVTSSPQIVEVAHLMAGDYEKLAETAPELAAGIVPCKDDCDTAMALRLIRLRRWGLAACLLERSLRLETSDTDVRASAEAHAWLGEALVQTGRSREAGNRLREAVDLAPESPLAWLLLGKHALVQGDFEAARIALYNAHQFDPESPAPCLAMAEMYAAQGRYSDAAPWIDAALERAPTEPNVWVSAARFYLTRDLAATAAVGAIVDRAVALAPEDPEVLVVAGWHRLNTGEPEAALQALNRAVDLAPNHPEAHFLQAVAYRQTGAPEEAARALTRAADLGEPRAQR